MKNLLGIYCIKNVLNGKIYIGSSIDCYKRSNRHFSELKNNKHKNKYLQNAYNKQEGRYFVFGIIELVNKKSNLIIREQFYIDKEKPEYNINLIANSSLGVKRNKETREKIKQANLGLKHPEWRNKIKSIAQGGENHWTKKKKFSNESKKKMSNSHKKLYENGYVNPQAKTIYQYTLDNKFLKEWKSCYEAARFYKCSETSIRNNVKNKTKKFGGFIWKAIKE